MPPVASEATNRAHKPALPNPARAAQNSDRAQDSPFASLLDDVAPASGDQPAPATPGDKVLRKASTKLSLRPLAGGDAVQASGNGTQTANPVAPDAAPDTAAEFVTAIGTAKTVGSLKTNAEGKTIKPGAAGDKAKPAGDGKSADVTAPGDAAGVTARDPIQTIVPVATAAPPPLPVPSPASASEIIVPAASSTVPQGAPDPVVQSAAATVPFAAPTLLAPAAAEDEAQPVPTTALPTAPGADEQTAPAVVPPITPAVNRPAANRLAVIADEGPQGKPADLAAPLADGGKPAGDSKPAGKTASAAKVDGKPQPATDDTDKPGASAAGSGSATNTHHSAAPETPGVHVADVRAAAPNAPADGLQQASLTPPTPNVSPAAANPAAAAALATPAAAIPLAGVAVEIAGKALSGKNRFEIRLDPPELGRIEVRLDVGRDGHVTSSLIADRPDTLDLLRRDSAGLERALQDAGLKTSDNGLQFSLRDQGMARDQSNAPSPDAARLVVSDDTLAAIDAQPRNYGRLAGLGGGIDIRV